MSTTTEALAGGANNDRIRIKGEQAFGPQSRLAVGYEIPLIYGYAVDAGDGQSSPSAQGLGDIKLNLSAVLGETDRFKHAAQVEFTFPSAPNDVVGSGQTVVRVAWGFSLPLAGKTVFDGTLAYNKAITARDGEEGENNFEPEAVLAHAFSKRIAGFLDWDTYQDFNADRFGQTMKGGLTIQLDRRGRWSFSPYAEFPLNHFTSETNLKSDIGFESSVRY